MTELVLGIDIGTASSKAVLADPDGRVVAEAERPHQLSLPRPGWAEHDADAVWWEDVVALCHEIVPGMADRIRCVCVSGIGPCLLPADESGTPLRPAILYGIDTRATAEIAELSERYGEDEIVGRCGSPLTSQAVGPKLLWLRRNEPEVWARTRRWFMASSFAVHRLTGEYVLDHHSASQSDPLYDMEAQDWIGSWAGDIVSDLPLPALAWPDDVVGEVTRDAGSATGLRPGTPVAAGTVDAWAEALSVGVRRTGDLMLMYGSTMFLVQFVRERASHPGLWATAGLDAESCCLAGGMATSGSLTDWLRRLVGGPSFGELLAEAAEVPAGSGGLLVLPYFAGERTPLFDPSARGVICGLTLGHGRGHLYRALLEATAYGVRHNLEAMEEAGGQPGRIVAVGGGTEGGLWTQIVSDVIGMAQEVPRYRRGASYGDALLAARAVGLVAPDTDWTELDHVVEPDAPTRERYEEMYAAYRDLYPATLQTVHTLAEMQTAAV